jgi:hypothetical protein
MAVGQGTSFDVVTSVDGINWVGVNTAPADFGNAAMTARIPKTIACGWSEV